MYTVDIDFPWRDLRIGAFPADEHSQPSYTGTRLDLLSAVVLETITCGYAFYFGCNALSVVMTYIEQWGRIMEQL